MLLNLNNILIYLKNIYSCEGKAEFSAAFTPVFSVNNWILFSY